ncbi:TonB-dependent receptor [Danxiaibacter flavus]|uniref:TonB-dependent receptor n=1 Tax=Danxiaibacter flavus TaxID=3049108 RepID=A0ABV3ZIZ0_9BACT|nr:TonB-dependent receptor [Chitinophagaceae bacterium DXS]
MLRLSIFFATLLLGVYATAQKANRSTATTEKSYLSGTVRDETSGKPLPQASIIIHDANAGAIANNNGEFKTTGVKEGKYLVEISYQGYTSILETVIIKGNTEKNYTLKPAIVEQEAVTVTGVASAIRLRLSPQPVSVLRQNDLLHVSSTNVMEGLSKAVPGVSVVTTGPAIAKPFIRGLGYNRVVVINDGVRQEGQQWGDEHGIEIDDYNVQKIEVLKGPASMMYGSDAIAGVINIQSQVPAPEGTIKGNVLAEYQTNSALRGFNGNIGGTKNGFSWNAYGTYKASHDYKNQYDGYVFNSKFAEHNFGAMAGYAGRWGFTRLYVSDFNLKAGMVEGDRDSATGKFIKAVSGGEEIATDNDFKSITPLIPYQHIGHFKVTADNSFNIGKNKLDVTLGYQRNQRREFGNIDAVDVPNAYFDLKTITYAARYHLTGKKEWKTSFGITGMSQTNTNRAEEVIIPDYSLFDIGGFIYTQYYKNGLQLSGGLRVDNRHAEGKQMLVDNEQKFAPFEKNFANVSGSAGLSYEVSKLVTLKLNVARGFRAPNFAELASNGAHEGTNRYEVGEKNLSSEVSFQVDGGVDINTEHVSINASLFYNNISNYIFYQKVLNGAGQDSIIVDSETGALLNVFRFSQHDAYLYGGEATIDIHPHPLDWLHFENSFSYTRAQFKEALDGSSNVPMIPAARLFSELRGNFLTKGKSIKNFYVSLQSDYNFKQSHPFTGYNTETATSDYWLINAGIGADIASKGRTLFSINIAGNNLGDIAYQNHLSRLKYTAENNVTGRTGVFNMGRNFTFKVSVPLNFNN